MAGLDPAIQGLKLKSCIGLWMGGSRPPMVIDNMISSSTAMDVARGVSRLLLEEGYSPILEFTLPNGRRLDVAAIGPGGEMLGVEIKVALADLRCDTK